MIKRFLCFLVVVALAVTFVPGVADAQQESPGGASNVRVFGGFSFLRFSATGDETIPELEENLLGLQGNLVYYFNQRIGFMVDGAFNTGSILPDEVPEGVTDADLTQTSLLFGPSFVLADTGAFTAQAYGAIGWAIGSVDVRGVNENDLPVFERLDDTAFAASFGANFDAMFGNGDWGVRFAQIEVLVAMYDETRTNFRYSAGIVGTF